MKLATYETYGVQLETLSMTEVLHDTLLPLENRIRAAIIYGLVARGGAAAGSDIDVMIVGDLTYLDVLPPLIAAKNRLGRNINPTVYSHSELRARLSTGNVMLHMVLEQPKIFLIGTEDDLPQPGEEGCE